MTERTPFIWTGRDDTPTEGARAMRWHQHVHPDDGQASNGAALIGFCSDEGVRRNGGRTGATDGPDALRRALANLAWHGRQPVYDAGNVRCEGTALETAQAQLGERIGSLLQRGLTPLVLGGGHEVAWGTWQGIAAAGRAQNIGIINIDAHFDLRRSAVAHSGTPFAQIADDCQQRGLPFHYFALGISALSNTAALFDTAKATGTRFLLDEQFATHQRDAVSAELGAWLAAREAIYLTVCLDAFPASVAPGVSAPAARGVEVAMAEWLIDLVIASGKLRVAEFAELCPRFDPDDRTARLAARLLARCAGAASPR